MGCLCPVSKFRSSEEEKTLMRAEEQIILPELSCRSFDREISRYASGEYISHKILKETYEAYSVDIEFFKDKREPSYHYYKILHANVLGYRVVTLVLIAIWLSDEDPLEKASRIFKNYDRKCLNKIGPEGFEIMIEDMIYATVTFIEFAKKMEPNKINLLEAYTKRLKNGKEYLKQYLLLLIKQGKDEEETFTEEEFLNAMKDSFVQKLCSSYGFRELLDCCNSLRVQNGRM
ncbi:unnamed protein product [Blepharisma stoltei]|uniref:Uncharacterized protein n=1 Tax=Blepharisma stoltei TaxID=1481888 RepID=A0AAU9JM26_9CILI|nr:unnamed protein product [Blepharisma stoltei]